MYIAIAFTVMNVVGAIYGYHLYNAPAIKVTVLGTVDYLDGKETRMILYSREDTKNKVFSQYENKFPECKKGDVVLLKNSFLQSFWMNIIGIFIMCLYYFSAFCQPYEKQLLNTTSTENTTNP